MDKLELETYLNWKDIISDCESCEMSSLWKFKETTDAYLLVCQYCGFIRRYDKEFVDEDWQKNKETILSNE